MSRYPARLRYISSPQDVYKAQDAEGAFSEADCIPQEGLMDRSAEVVQEELNRLARATGTLMDSLAKALQIIEAAAEDYIKDVEKIVR